jgi:hypothetical protein
MVDLCFVIMTFYDLSLSTRNCHFHPFHTFNGLVVWDGEITTAYFITFVLGLLGWHSFPYLHGSHCHSLCTRSLFFFFLRGSSYCTDCRPS